MSAKKGKIKIDKIDAAKRHFREAVLLFFERRDPVVIHHLAHAAHEILSKKTNSSFILTEELFRPGGFAVFKKYFSISKNYIKHCDDGSNTPLEFDTEINVCILLDCACMIKTIYPTNFTAIMFIFWCMIKYPNFFAQEKLSELLKMADPLKINADDFEEVVRMLKLYPN